MERKPFTLTDYHQQRNKVVTEAVNDSLKHPISLEDAMAQAERIKQQSQSAEKKGQILMKK